MYSWLCNDLKYVDKNKIVMLCAHSSMFRKPDSEPAERDKHGPDYASRLAQYRFVHSWAGHSHINFNYAYAAEEPAAKFPNVESHILARSTGALWLNERISTDGTPRGYLVVDVDGEQISWYYKPLGLGRDRQIRAYAPGVWYDDGYVYANVWNHDARWGEVRYTDSGKDKAEMKRVTAMTGPSSGWPTTTIRRRARPHSSLSGPRTCSASCPRPERRRRPSRRRTVSANTIRLRWSGNKPENLTEL